MAGSQDFKFDPRNEHILVYLNGALVSRVEAKVSVFDAGFSLGDGVWEGIRLHKGGLLFLDAHISRLLRGASSIGLDTGLSGDDIARIVKYCLNANKMSDGVHLRLMVTRGLKATVSQDPRNALGKPTVVVVPEYKRSTEQVKQGIRLHTCTIRCTPSSMFDMRLNSHSRLNLIMALREAIDAGADEAVMLDPDGLVSSCNATNLFWVKNDVVYTSNGEYCFNGITRQNIIDLAGELDIELRRGRFALQDLRSADAIFLTGTMGGVTGVSEIDGRQLAATVTPVVASLVEAYERLKAENSARHPILEQRATASMAINVLSGT